MGRVVESGLAGRVGPAIGRDLSRPMPIVTVLRRACCSGMGRATCRRRIRSYHDEQEGHGPFARAEGTWTTLPDLNDDPHSRCEPATASTVYR